MSKMTKEFAAKYLKEELDSRLKNLGGQPDALCQAYQAALDAMAPKKKCYVFTVETRDAQAYLEPACIPPSDEDEWENRDIEELDDEDIWADVSGSIIYDRIYVDFKEEAVQAFIKKCPQHDIDQKFTFNQGTQAPSIATSVNSDYACRLGGVSAPHVYLHPDFEYISLPHFYFCHSQYTQNNCLPKSMASSNNFLTHRQILSSIILK